MNPSGLCFVNASLPHGRRGSLRAVGDTIVGLDLPPEPGDRVLDLQGDRLLPGLINAHDHLQLNNLPRLKYRPQYTNFTQWVDDIQPRLSREPLFIAHHALPRTRRLLIGGVKNLLCGATTVAHHDPGDDTLQAAEFPVRVLAEQGWSHSLSLDGAAAVTAARERTPDEWPWLVHAAEGTDAAAAADFDALDALGCLRANTLLVHGVALDAARRRRLVEAGAALVWCPGSNEHLFGCTVAVEGLFGQGRLALGSDSRISGERDLLDELRVAANCSPLDDAALELLVTERNAQLLRCPDRGVLRPGACADFVVLPADMHLTQARRSDLRLVVVAGQPRYADRDLGAAFDPLAFDPVRVDGRDKLLARGLVAMLREADIAEPGLELSVQAPGMPA